MTRFTMSVVRVTKQKLSLLPTCALSNRTLCSKFRQGDKVEDGKFSGSKLFSKVRAESLIIER